MDLPIFLRAYSLIDRCGETQLFSGFETPLTNKLLRFRGDQLAIVSFHSSPNMDFNKYDLLKRFDSARLLH